MFVFKLKFVKPWNKKNTMENQCNRHGDEDRSHALNPAPHSDRRHHFSWADTFGSETWSSWEAELSKGWETATKPHKNKHISKMFEPYSEPDFISSFYIVLGSRVGFNNEKIKQRAFPKPSILKALVHLVRHVWDLVVRTLWLLQPNSWRLLVNQRSWSLEYQATTCYNMIIKTCNLCDRILLGLHYLTTDTIWYNLEPRTVTIQSSWLSERTQNGPKVIKQISNKRFTVFDTGWQLSHYRHTRNFEASIIPHRSKHGR